MKGRRDGGRDQTRNGHASKKAFASRGAAYGVDNFLSQR